MRSVPGRLVEIPARAGADSGYPDRQRLGRPGVTTASPGSSTCTFKGSAVSTWAKYTAANVCASGATTCSEIAVVLDGVVQSAETIQSAIPDGQTQISGSFTHKSANQLAQILKYGSLKIAFKTQTAEDISATSGNKQLQAGLLAGAIGLALVLLYSFFYYRGLSLVTVLSLALSAALQYPMIVILGKTINYTLSWPVSPA